MSTRRICLKRVINFFAFELQDMLNAFHLNGLDRLNSNLQRDHDITYTAIFLILQGGS